MAIILTNCTNRKRGSAASGLTVDELTPGLLDNVAKQWLERLEKASSANLAREVYCGRSFREADASAAFLRCPLYIVSAGLGIVSSTRLIPVYNFTIISGTANSAADKITGNFSPKLWWSKIVRANPFGSSLIHTLEQHSDGLILIALSRQYVQLLQEELANLPIDQQRRLRFFGKLMPVLPGFLTGNWMPYDDRLDCIGSGFSGTQTDFAQRALRHFVTELLNNAEDGDAYAHRAMVLDSLSPISRREIPKRRRVNDDEICIAIQDNWAKGRGQSSALLRIIRDKLGIACEQSRFRTIYYSVKKIMGGADEAK
jgi:hypothetical protein